MKIGGGAGAPKERGPSHQLYVTPAPAPAPTAAPLSNRRIVRMQPMTNDQRYKENRNADLEKSRSLDSEYERYQYSDFDKSRSFDEDYGEHRGPSENRSFSIDQVYLKGQRKVNEPPNYNNSGGGSNARLYDHELMYEMSRSQRSPVIDNYKRQQQKMGHSARTSRKRSPNLNRDASYRSTTRNMDPSKGYRDPSPSNVSTIVVNHSTTIGSSGGHTSPGSDYDGNAGDYDYDYECSVRGNAINEELIKEAKLVSDFLYGNSNRSNKADTHLNSHRRRDAKPTSNRSHVSAGPNAVPSSSSAVASARYIRN